MKKNSIMKNIFHLFYSTILANLLVAISLILLANYFNSKNYGIFSVALALAMVMNFFTDLGVSNTFLREGSKIEGLASKITSYIKVRSVFLLITIVIIFLGVSVLYNEQIVLRMIYNLLFPMVIGLMLQNIGITYFQLTEKMQFIARIKIFSAIVLMTITILCMVLKVNVYLVAFLYGFSYLVGGVYSLYELRRNIEIKWNLPFQKQLLSNLTPFLWSGLLIMLTPQLGPLVLEKTLPLTLVGIFAVAYRIPSALYQLPGVIAGAFFPLLFKHYNQGKLMEHTQLNMLQMKMMSLIGMCMTVSIFHLAGVLIMALFGSKWESAVLPLKILSFIVVLQGINIAIADGLTTRGLQNRRTFVQFLAIAAGFFSFFYLSVNYGVAGAAYAVLIMEMVSLIGYLLAYPMRRTVLTEVLIPYGACFSISFILLNYLLDSYPIVAMLLTMISITSIILLFDMTIKGILHDFLRKKKQQINTYFIDRRQRENG